MEGGILSSHNSSNSLYRECLRNHAANLGSYATDGCGEFTLDNNMSPGSLQCAACGCHRNFHRKVTCPPTLSHGTELMDYSGDGRGGSNGGEGRLVGNVMLMESVEGEMRTGENKKRFRTKFTSEQKEKMLGFAEKLGWKLQRKDVDAEIERFCKSVGVSRQVFKVWMHNHKNSSSLSPSASIGNASSLTQ